MPGVNEERVSLDVGLVSSRVELSEDTLVFLASLGDGENVLGKGEDAVTVSVVGRGEFEKGGFMAVILGQGSFYVNNAGVVSGARDMTGHDIENFVRRYGPDREVADVSDKIGGEAARVIH